MHEDGPEEDEERARRGEGDGREKRKKRLRQTEALPVHSPKTFYTPRTHAALVKNSVKTC
jgi:hypothetical protein